MWIGYWAVKIVTDVPEAIPIIGSPLVELYWQYSTIYSHIQTNTWEIFYGILSVPHNIIMDLNNVMKA